MQCVTMTSQTDTTPTDLHNLPLHIEPEPTAELDDVGKDAPAAPDTSDDEPGHDDADDADGGGPGGKGAKPQRQQPVSRFCGALPPGTHLDTFSRCAADQGAAGYGRRGQVLARLRFDDRRYPSYKPFRAGIRRKM